MKTCEYTNPGTTEMCGEPATRMVRDSTGEFGVCYCEEHYEGLRGVFRSMDEIARSNVGRHNKKLTHDELVAEVVRELTVMRAQNAKLNNPPQENVRKSYLTEREGKKTWASRNTPLNI